MAGGNQMGGDKRTFAEVFFYDVEEGTWSDGPDLPVALTMGQLVRGRKIFGNLLLWPRPPLFVPTSVRGPSVRSSICTSEEEEEESSSIPLLPFSHPP